MALDPNDVRGVCDYMNDPSMADHMRFMAEKLAGAELESTVLLIDITESTGVFTIEKNGTELPVRYAKCIVPDTFRDIAGMDLGVTVEGELRPDGSFEASQVLAKCPSKYEMKQKQAQGENAPHAAMTAPMTP
jgi:cytochrome c-type biogenesis protein CcmE